MLEFPNGVFDEYIKTVSVTVIVRLLGGKLDSRTIILSYNKILKIIYFSKIVQF